MSNLSMLLSQSDQAPASDELRRLENVRALRSARQRQSSTAEAIAVRMLGAADAPELMRLAGLDSSDIPAGSLLGAEIDGVLVAAVSLADGTAISDPFRSSGSAVELLQLRARQLGAPRRGLPRLRRRRRAHAALAGSPPGAGGRLLQL